MARKNLIEATTNDGDRPAAQSPRDSRPIAGFVPQGRAASPVGGITKTLGNITEKIERANDLEKRLAEGHAVVTLDTSLIDGSFVADRLEIDAADLALLTDQIREHGQQVPILVRPHPAAKGRYQVAYGHRRLAAAKALGIQVRAVVRELTDDQLVVSQGQENSARSDLAYIERALFASRLGGQGFSRDVIMSALSVDKQALSKMLGVIKQVPLAVINAIGAAPEIGRRRWMEFGELLSEMDPKDLIDELSADDARTLTSNERFHRAFDLVSRKLTLGKTASAASPLPDLPVRFKKTPTTATFVFDSKAAPGFDQFVQERLKDLFAEFQKDRGA